jgi:hypothetical protein
MGGPYMDQLIDREPLQGNPESGREQAELLLLDQFWQTETDFHAWYDRVTDASEAASPDTTRQIDELADRYRKAPERTADLVAGLSPDFAELAATNAIQAAFEALDIAGAVRIMDQATIDHDHSQVLIADALIPLIGADMVAEAKSFGLSNRITSAVLAAKAAEAIIQDERVEADDAMLLHSLEKELGLTRSILANTADHLIAAQFEQGTPDEADNILHSAERRLHLPPSVRERWGSQTEGVLANFDAASNEVLEGGANTIKLIQLDGDGSAIFKPRDGEARGMRDEIEVGTYYRRERAAYLVDHSLRINLVPPTIIRELDGEIGSLQDFAENAQLAVISRDPFATDRIHDLYLLDLLIWNTDRNGTNFLLENIAELADWENDDDYDPQSMKADPKSREIYAIDNSLTFARGISGYIVESITPTRETANGILEFSRDIVARHALLDQLDELLPQAEVDAFEKRLDSVIESLEAGPTIHIDTAAKSYDNWLQAFNGWEVQ